MKLLCLVFVVLIDTVIFSTSGFAHSIDNQIVIHMDEEVLNQIMLKLNKAEQLFSRI